ncbi:hypothetical protein DSCA_36740 [Desulfosarcina alkanivorans]|uniref:4Fe-4S ferredoxin-type domain-containing protein n=1 Tax=Desulfosarcina alkanivorans TaxID=571177 RepID=A0A5K7YTY1_9BACT|nr:(Fe-S)-binding protein [Desulfosarcina alkanivorans]BBO69744.1 hypothetical protein DSCA_36740 [Desulfosarcina alkanivorans]
MFREDLCNRCGKCLSQCPWMEVDGEEAIGIVKKLIKKEYSSVLKNCITCFACNEICPEQAYPFDLIASLQEKYYTLFPKEKLKAVERRFSSNDDEVAAFNADSILSLCVFKETDPELIKGALYDMPQVSGNPYFCWVLFSHIGGASIQEKHVKRLIQNLARNNPKEVVCFHDDCYTMLSHFAPEYGLDVPFRPVHLAEHLLRRLKPKHHSLKSLNVKIAYQRPCASRYTPEKENFIDELLDLVGAERVDRKYDRENAMCCAGVKKILGMGDPTPHQEENVKDAINAGAQALVCLCPMCMHALSPAAHRNRLPVLFIGDLARMALGEIKVNAFN